MPMPTEESVKVFRAGSCMIRNAKLYQNDQVGLRDWNYANCKEDFEWLSEIAPQMNPPDMQYAIVKISVEQTFFGGPGFAWVVYRYDRANTHLFMPDVSHCSYVDNYKHVMTVERVLSFYNLTPFSQPYHAIRTTQKALEEIYQWGKDL